MSKEIQSRLLNTQATPLEQLQILVTELPQREDASAPPAYLPTNGVAVELVTGHVRPHDDLDILVCDGKTKKWGEFDIFTPGDYLAGMKFNPEFFQTTAVEVPLLEGEEVYVVHPGIIMVQKATKYPYGGVDFPRKKDVEEVARIMTYWQHSAPNPESWDAIVDRSIKALPVHRRRPTTQSLNKIAKQLSRG